MYEADLARGTRRGAQAAEDAGADAGEQTCQPRPGDEACPTRCPERCNGRDDDCDGEVDEAEASQHCALAHAHSVCNAGECRIARCDEGYRDCDERADNGCEVVASDPAHCLGCGRGCDMPHARATCLRGECRVGQCERGFADCDADRLSCETRVDTDDHCGACGLACTQLPYARASCLDGRCRVRACDPGRADCDGDPENGCEQTLDTLQHCGGCGMTCGKATCRGGVCTAVTCDRERGLADCDADGRTCETDLARDLVHCGSCDNACRFRVETPHADPSCDGGSCRALCDVGFADCNARFDDGCETQLTSDQHCGACGHVCATQHGQSRCLAGECALLACEAGWADCDGDPKACERALDRVDSCGSCERRCQLAHAIARCAPSPARCEIERCEPGWEDCDGNMDNGCERDSGGLGPCLPDPSCAMATQNGHNFYFCNALKSWDDARAACRAQRNGDLARLRDAATRDFVRARLRERVWIGHTDRAKADLWVWASNGVPFWQGRENGKALNGAFASWLSAEPNGSGDCGALAASGGMDDLSCSTAQPFVCEVSVDLCPDDSNKNDPGQCGCGRQDLDSNGDGFADCPKG
mgnify:CR=1 FL=1